ncbi:DNA polymerase-3 subunit delta [Enterococcus sp. PF1-24]|uniref:DNA polymerase III subunit delta n=1 Tax=unclassified Enterococcus TaxID=2608891 RepID=UPI002475E792|nr:MULTISPECIES: DNA polymerase III subunit delta [unclassified Enterococcus]MDH6364026.1 DNA polymerase-3 subunit delta [Enterococcus sp. PFB1-1]MDH6401127.1 DNA polymerase-3 subunit delta [Enterococcus sp. PF1-24]
MNTQTAIQRIRSQALKNIYLVLGTETYLQLQVRQAFLERLQISDEEDLNFTLFDLTETSMATLLDEAESLPFFGDYRLIFAENPFFLTGNKTAGDVDLTDFLKYIENPLETTILVFFAPYDKLDERKKATKLLKKQSQLIEVHAPETKELHRYVQQLFDNQQLTISRENFDYFMNLTDHNLTKIVSEFEKIVLYLGSNQTVSQEVLNELIPKTLEHNIFDMTNYVLAGKTEAALRLFDDLVLQGEETIKISAILISLFRLLLQTKILVNIGYQQANIASTLGVHPYRAKVAMQQARGMTAEKIAQIYDQLVENDYLTKSGQGDKNLMFQLFVMKLGKLV